MIQIDLILVLIILLLHWAADFVCQTDWEAQNKSKSMNALLSHTVKYSALWFPFMLVILGPMLSIVFTLVTFISHTVTDYVTSRINTRYHQQGKIHEFFVSIGFDQWLHTVQLLVTYVILR